MTVVEEQIEGGAALYDTSDRTTALAIRKDRNHFKTLLWPSPFGVGDALDAFRPIVESADPDAGTELTFFSSNGYSQRETDQIPEWIDKLRGGPEGVARFRIECVIPGIGPVIFTFNREVPGLKVAQNTMSVTAKSIDHPCLRKLYESSAAPEIRASFKEIAQ